MRTHIDSINAESRGTAARGHSGFTMIEIALCLGIIAFALVAIMGVLPTGLKVQKENREETIVNQDGVYLLEAIRGGAKGIDDLTNYVESITVIYGRSAAVMFTNSPSGGNRLTNGQQIIGLMSTPKVERLPNGTWRTNAVEVRMKAISGVASDRSRFSEDMAFRYIVRPEVIPFMGASLIDAETGANTAYSTNLLHNLYDLRLLFRWPLFPKGDSWDTGRGRKLFRTLVSGELKQWQVGGSRSPYSFYWFEPNTFTTNHYSATF